MVLTTMMEVYFTWHMQSTIPACPAALVSLPAPWALSPWVTIICRSTPAAASTAALALVFAPWAPSLPLTNSVCKKQAAQLLAVRPLFMSRTYRHFSGACRILPYAQEGSVAKLWFCNRPFRSVGQSLRLVGADFVSLASPEAGKALSRRRTSSPHRTRLCRASAGPRFLTVPPPFTQGRLLAWSVLQCCSIRRNFIYMFAEI